MIFLRVVICSELNHTIPKDIFTCLADLRGLMFVGSHYIVRGRLRCYHDDEWPLFQVEFFSRQKGSNITPFSFCAATLNGVPVCYVGLVSFKVDSLSFLNIHRSANQWMSQLITQ